MLISHTKQKQNSGMTINRILYSSNVQYGLLPVFTVITCKHYFPIYALIDIHCMFSILLRFVLVHRKKK